MRLTAALALVASLAAPASAQFSAYDWSFEMGGSSNALNGDVTNTDELTLEILNCIGYAGSVSAESVAPETGVFTFDLAGEEWIDQSCSQCGFGYCGFTVTEAFGSLECSQPVSEPLLQEEWGGACQEPELWTATWSVPVLAGECWRFGIWQDGWSLDCNSRVIATNLTFQPAPPVVVSTVTATPAYKQSVVTLTGSGFEHVTEVIVDGESTPILSQSTGSLVIRPAVAPAGFGDLLLRNDTFLLQTGTLARWPALTTETASGTTVDVALAAGLPGPWQLVISLDTMPPLALGANTFGFLELDVVASPWLLLPGTLDGNGDGAFSLPIPQAAGLSGLEVFLQARGPAGFGTTFTTAFSNAESVVLP